jgi:thiamine-monophosphate kinase
MLGFSKNKNTNQKFIKEFVRGLKSVQDEFKLCLIGGDTVVSEKLFFSITIFGVVKKGQILARVNAKAGDLIFVSGTIGDAFLGLKNVKKEYFNHLGASEKKYFLERHFFPTPRINLGQQLLKNKLSNCAIDISDGLLADLKHICKTSELAAEIFLNEIPLSKPAKKVLEKNSQIKPLDLFCAGDDYELIFAVNPKNEKKILELAKSLPLKISCIGKFFEAADKKFEITLRDWENKKIKIKKFGYEH